MGKSAAKIHRNQVRAAARGESYTPPLPASTSLDASQNDDNDNDDDVDSIWKSAAAQKLECALTDLDKNADGLNSKEQRTAKQKAKAITSEEAGCPVDQLLEWNAGRHQKKHAGTNNDKTSGLTP